jgi:hypothetical protein
MKNNKIGNIVLMLSLAFFLMASVAAFVPELGTHLPDAEATNIETVMGACSCCTCTTGPGGPYTQCASASYCGMNFCQDGSPCNMGNGVCGPDCENGGCQGTELCEN